MNLNIVKEQLLKIGEKISLQVEEQDTQKLTLHTEIQAKQYFNSTVYLRIVVFSSGTLHVFFTFYEIDSTYDNLYLINAFNSENPWFRGYITNINNKDYFELHYAAIAIENEQSVVDVVGYLLTELLKENTLKYLQPIVNGNKYVIK